MNDKPGLFAEKYAGYAYSYPHKHAYRRLDEKIPVEKIWHTENKEALFLYVHIPFCEMRCGFCNLFTIANPKEDVPSAYLDTLQVQAEVMKNILGDAKFGQIAVGGGTPTYLELQELERLFFILHDVLGADLQASPFSFEMSPKTISKEKLRFLFTQGVDRVSMGVQSFLDAETGQLGRPQKSGAVYEALDMIRSENFAVLNLDLIYGIAGQTRETWLQSIREALKFSPEEMYLYPLYVRPLTGLGKKNLHEENQRDILYRAGRDYLLENNYEQISLRMFRKKDTAGHARKTMYRCQEDGMLGLGAGARSYTKAFHYSSEYAVERKSVREIIAGYISKNAEDFRYADYGFHLDSEEQKRRFLIKSLLHGNGLDTMRYEILFGSPVAVDFPVLHQLEEEGMTMRDGERILLTASGMEYADAIGPWLYSQQVHERIRQFELR
ncbi:MAG: oxygen-independent coproporphyrinogen III oxidase [Bacteroidetes bacterium]|nr:MAG: oxygen-independent coproporphyrinogen III oxidase [Bacteroidota bacterium]